MLSSTKSSKRSRNVPEGLYEVAYLLLKLLPSKDGAVLRRLLMTADPVSLARTMVSKDAFLFRQHVSRVLADLIFLWMIEAVREDKTSDRCDHLIFIEAQQARETALSSGISLPELQPVLRDRRLKVIFYRVINNIRRNPILMLKVCWSLFTIFMTASILALHRFLVYWSETYLKSIAFIPWRFAISV